jgi:hypothetical protein
MAFKYIRDFLSEEIPSIIHLGNRSNKIDKIILDLNNEHNETPTLLLNHSDSIPELFTIETNFLDTTIIMRYLDINKCAELIIDIGKIKFSRMVLDADLFEIWKILESQKDEIGPSDAIEIFCKKLEMKYLGEKIIYSAHQIMFLEFMAYYLIYKALGDNNVLNSDENIALLPWQY